MFEDRPLPRRWRGRRMWSSFEELERMRHELMRFFEEPALAWTRLWGPRSDVYESGDELVVKVELPGVDPKNLDVRVYEDRVVIRGTSEEETTVEEGQFYRRERRQGSFHRVIPLDVEVVPEKARATFRNGLLELHIPKAEPADDGHRVPID
ncbi:MAG: Hsp20/alpha crystallin family protein [Bacillota bacterium]|nr:Hsp20/alpha crystallin family protein [Bacillota bacterium]